MTYVGVMRAAIRSGMADDAAERRLARQIFGTPLDRRTSFVEPHGFWWAVLDGIWPSANFIEVWQNKGACIMHAPSPYGTVQG